MQRGERDLFLRTRLWIKSKYSQAPFVATFVLFLSGILFWGAFNWSLELTNTETFCISCHEMNDNIYPEYQNSIHFQNRSGVRATCPDCHVPRNWIDKVVRKVGATNELIHKVMGSINTREKFIGKRLALAEHVWSAMEDSESLECRNCHELTYMSTKAQEPIKAHGRAKEQNMTCIDCHKGIAHELPEEFIESEHLRYENENINCGNCHANLERETWDDDWG